MKDTIFINGLTVETIIGVFDWEREVRQTLVLDLELATDISAAASTDQLEHTLDYGAISEHITHYIEHSQFQLIETLAEQVALILQNEFNIGWLKLTLYKPGAVANASSVGLIIERGNTELRNTEHGNKT